MTTAEEHIAHAQKAAEERLELAYAVMNGDVDDENDELLGDFDGCVTCEVREILDAAEPHLRLAWASEQIQVSASGQALIVPLQEPRGHQGGHCEQP